MLLYFRPRVLRIRASPVVGIFFAIDRCHVSWIFIKIRPPDSQLLAVRVNPFPRTFACNESLRALKAGREVSTVDHLAENLVGSYHDPPLSYP